jgi:uncharacterized protein YgbK (DUF1537 family)
MLLGCIADDFTGATDLANNLVRSGMRVVQTIGIPSEPIDTAADAVVVALKSRTIAPQDAIHQSVAALRWLKSLGAKQFYQKICSTFDSTDQGNIGPVAEALLAELDASFAVVCPAFPENGRTVFKGYLFAGDVLLNESSMRDHPLTPMRDPNLVRVLQRQSKGKVGLIDHTVVRRGSEAVRDAMLAQRQDGKTFAIVDATSNEDLQIMGRAFADTPLIVAGSGVGIGLPQNHGLVANEAAAELPSAAGHRAIISGSCSVMSNAQVKDFLDRGGEGLAIDPLRIAGGDDIVGQALDWASSRLSDKAILIYATASPDVVKASQAALGVANTGEMVENCLSTIARGLVQRGFRQLLVAGGETSGACVQALDITRMRIGLQIDPGVPWCHAESPVAGEGGVHLALKSGNFGTVDFFTKAFALLK